MPLMPRRQRDMDESAFPLTWADDDGTHYRLGMSLRDYFAGKALIAYWIPDPNSVAGTCDDAAAFCYKMADAMMKARK